MTRPKVSRVYNNGVLIFCCRKCKTEFSIYQDREKYCHNCGEKQVWSEITFRNIDDASYKKFQLMSYYDQEQYLQYLDNQEMSSG